jgi:hypothetical protein
VFFYVEAEWAGADLNRRHTDFQSVALPTELPARLLAKDKFSKKTLDCKKIQNSIFSSV